jgi:hypothetical protein
LRIAPTRIAKEAKKEANMINVNWVKSGEATKRGDGVKREKEYRVDQINGLLLKEPGTTMPAIRAQSEPKSRVIPLSCDDTVKKQSFFVI